MVRKSPAPDRPPRRSELLDAIDKAERQLTVLFSKWWNGVPVGLRIELHDIEEPLLRLLIRANRR